MKRFICILSVILGALLASLEAANVTCLFSKTGNPPLCDGLNDITPVTSVDEEIYVTGQSTCYADLTKDTIMFNSGKILNYIPTKLFKYFPNFSQIYLSDVQLTTIITNAFTDCKNLRHIGLGGNPFTHLEAGFAQQCPNVLTISLTDNEMSSLHVNALKGLTNLYSFLAKRNKITCIPPGFFSHTPILQNIEISDNLISALDPNTFVTLKKLTNMFIDSNELSYIPKINFASKVPQSTLMFKNNPITALDPNFLKGIYSSGWNVYTEIKYDFTNFTSCLPQPSPYPLIDKSNWKQADLTLKTCYANWTPDMACSKVNCFPSATTTPMPTTTTKLPGKTTLTPNQSLKLNQTLISPNNCFYLLFQSDGNLVLYRRSNREALWSSNTIDTCANKASMKSDGNFVITNCKSAIVWESGTATKNGAYLTLANDGNVMIYQGSNCVWMSRSRTYC